MLRVRQQLATLRFGVALMMALGGPAGAASPPSPARGRPTQPRAYLIYLIDGGDPIVVQKYTEQDGQIRFEKFGGWVSIASYEVRRIVPDEPDDAEDAIPAARTADGPEATALRHHPERRERPGHERRRRAHELRGPRQDPRGLPHSSARPTWSGCCASPRRPPRRRPGSPWEAGPTALPSATRRSRLHRTMPRASLPSLSDRPHLLQLANGVVIQVEGFWLEAGEIRFRRLGGVVGFALGEIARLLPQEVASVRGRLPARFVRRLGPDRVEVRLREGLKRVRLIGIEPARAPESPVVGRPRRSRTRGPRSTGAPGPPRVRPRALRARRRLAGLPLPAERADAERRADPGRPAPARE